MDPFLCCGTLYRDVKEALVMAVLQNRSDTLVAQLQVNPGDGKDVS